MEQKQLFKQMLDFQKTTFENSFNAMVLLQEHTEKASKTLLDQVTWLPDEGRKASNEWIAACKKGRDDFKALVDENFSKMEAIFDDNATAAKTRKPKSKAQNESVSKKAK